MASRESPLSHTVLPTGGICPYKEYCRAAFLHPTPDKDGDQKGPAVVCRASLLSYAFDWMSWGDADAAVCWASLRGDPRFPRDQVALERLLVAGSDHRRRDGDRP